jgi:hypothetical protein
MSFVFFAGEFVRDTDALRPQTFYCADGFVLTVVSDEYHGILLNPLYDALARLTPLPPLTLTSYYDAFTLWFLDPTKYKPNRHCRRTSPSSLDYVLFAGRFRATSDLRGWFREIPKTFSVIDDDVLTSDPSLIGPPLPALLPIGLGNELAADVLFKFEDARVARISGLYSGPQTAPDLILRDTSISSTKIVARMISSQAPYVITYILNEITLASQARKFVELFPREAFGLVSVLAARTTSECTNGNERCSLLYGTPHTPLALFVQEKYAQMGVAESEQVKALVCETSPALEECACFSRELRADYMAHKDSMASAPTACWYKPCSNPLVYHVPATMDKPICPSDMCSLGSSLPADVFALACSSPLAAGSFVYIELGRVAVVLTNGSIRFLADDAHGMRLDPEYEEKASKIELAQAQQDSFSDWLVTWSGAMPIGLANSSDTYALVAGQFRRIVSAASSKLWFASPPRNLPQISSAMLALEGMMGADLAEIPPYSWDGTPLVALLAQFESSFRPTISISMLVSSPALYDFFLEHFSLDGLYSSTPSESSLLEPSADQSSISRLYFVDELLVLPKLQYIYDIDPIAFNKLVPILSATLTSLCPEYYEGKMCSMLMSSSDPIGLFLQAVIERKGVDASQAVVEWTGDRDAVYSHICQRHPDLIECKCLLRDDDPDFARPGSSDVSSLCSYKPCLHSDKFFVPSQASVCAPGGVCLLADTSQPIRPLSWVIDCPPASPIVKPVVPPPAPTPDTTPVVVVPVPAPVPNTTPVVVVPVPTPVPNTTPVVVVPVVVRPDRMPVPPVAADQTPVPNTTPVVVVSPDRMPVPPVVVPPVVVPIAPPAPGPDATPIFAVPIVPPAPSPDTTPIFAVPIVPPAPSPDTTPIFAVPIAPPAPSPSTTPIFAVPIAPVVVPNTTPIVVAPPVVPNTTPIAVAPPVVPNTTPIVVAPPVVVPNTTPIVVAPPVVVPNTTPIVVAPPVVVPNTTPIVDASGVVPNTTPLVHAPLAPPLTFVQLVKSQSLLVSFLMLCALLASVWKWGYLF